MLFAVGAVKNRLLPRSRSLLLILTVLLPLTLWADEEFFETLPNGTRPPSVSGTNNGEAAFAGAARQGTGPLSGRIVFTCGGHGWTWDGEGWTTQRGVGLEMNEDYGNLDQMNFFVPYVFNAGATVVPLRPVGYQTNEVVLDNDSPGVKFVGKWYKSRSTVFYGHAGAVPYRFAVLGKTETATATYTPKLPAAGFYPVYTWVRHGPDRTSQLYRILHTGGETLVRVPHHMVGNGWVYLGTYYFDAGADRKRGSVVISNLAPSPGFGAVAVADAIRFGNGMGDVVPQPRAPVSGYPREEEASLYWVQKSLGHSQASLLPSRPGDQITSNVGAPPRMARVMNRPSEGDMFKRIYISFHSNSSNGRARGALGLWNNPRRFPGTDTPHQERLAQLVGGEVTETLGKMSVPPLELPWSKRPVVTYARTDYAFGEINNRYIRDEFDATILEVAFHDSRDDTKLLRDPKVRDIVARCSYRAVVKYMNEFDGAPLRFLPEPPRDVRATTSTEGVTVAWDRPENDDRNSVEGYLVYRSQDGYGFGAPIRVPASQTSLMLPEVARGKDIYFRVTALNEGGESLPSAVAGCCPARKQASPRVLYVNGFTEFDRFNNVRQTIRATNYLAPAAFGRMDRVIPRLNNAFDYVVQHGKALAVDGVAFDSCQRGAVAEGAVRLEQYEAVVWAAGNQTKDLFSATEQAALARYLSHGGDLFVSGSHIGDWLGACATNSCALGRQLHSVPADAVEESAPPRSFTAVKRSLFRGRDKGAFGQGRDQSYFVKAVSRLQGDCSGAHPSLLYADGPGAAAIKYDGSEGGGRTVCLGFPFECVSAAKARARGMKDVLRFFGCYQRPRWVTQPEITPGERGALLEWRTVPGRKYQVQSNTLPGGVLWQNLGRPVVASGLSLAWRDEARAEAAAYRVLLLN
jgi:hypothetical protein